MNRKAARRAKLIALSQHAALGSLGVFDGGTFSSAKTKDAGALVRAWGQQLPLVVLVGEEESAAALSFRNLERVIVAWAEDITVVELLWARSLLADPELSRRHLAVRPTPPAASTGVVTLSSTDCSSAPFAR